MSVEQDWQLRLPCGRWGYTCDRLYCQARCCRLDGDDHGRGEHRCAEHGRKDKK